MQLAPKIKELIHIEIYHALILSPLLYKQTLIAQGQAQLLFISILSALTRQVQTHQYDPAGEQRPFI